MARKSYHVRFGDSENSDGFGFRGRGIVSIDDKVCTYTGKKPWPNVVRIAVGIILIAVFSALTWCLAGDNQLFFGWGLLAGFIASCIIVSCFCTFSLTIEIPLASISKATLEDKTVTFVAEQGESKRIREGVIRLQSASEATALHADIAASLPAQPSLPSTNGPTHDKSAPGPAKGVLWWAALICVWYVQAMQAGSTLGIVLLLCLLMTLAICVWWYSVSKLHYRRSLLPRLTGYILFGLGSIMPMGLATSLALQITRNGGSTAHIFGDSLLISAVGAAVVAAMVAGAYWLVFAPSPDTESSGNR